MASVLALAGCFGRPWSRSALAGGGPACATWPAWRPRSPSSARRRRRASTAARLASRAAIRSGAGAVSSASRLHRDLLARRLALDQVEHPLAVLVVVLRGIELARQRVDQLLGHRQLAVGRLAPRRPHRARRGGPESAPRRRTASSLSVSTSPRWGAARTAAAWSAARPCRCRPCPTRASHRAAAGRPSRHRRSGPGSRSGRSRSGRSRPGRRTPRCRSSSSPSGPAPRAPRADRHVAVGRELVALDDLLVGDFLARRGIDPLLADASPGLARQLVEADRLGRCRAVQLDGHVDQPEADRACPDCAGHIRFVYRTSALSNL